MGCQVPIHLSNIFGSVKHKSSRRSVDTHGLRGAYIQGIFRIVHNLY